ncbi:hypothetical protein BSKO_01170 [Bryopsis sp. KO-2023]|nr:hypothetical protein BSKO_01170 [Bryopsis sp. KO-2023]
MVQQGRSWEKFALYSALCAGGAGYLAYCLWKSANQQCKPQNNFRVLHADNSDSPFQHLVLDADGNEVDGRPTEQAVHPYWKTIDLLRRDCPEHLVTTLKSSDTSGGGGRWVWVDKKIQLDDLMKELQGVDQFAVDVEHHKLRSYRGFICLIQIFTGTCTYLLDAVALHDEVHVLNSVFANPKIRKVAHGCHNDVLWLQRDFKIYLVNVFDTEKACQVLNKPTRNLAHLLKFYFGIVSDKSLQVADWRRRPLSKEQLLYARMDVEHLLRLERILIQELLDQDEIPSDSIIDFMPDAVSLQLANRKSQETCLNLYTSLAAKEATRVAALHMIRKHMLDGSGMIAWRLGEDESCEELSARRREDVFRDCVFQLCVWRDEVARREDESCEFILKNRVLVALAIQCPRTPSAIMSLATSTPIHELEAGEVDCQTDVKYWEPSLPFSSEVEKIAGLINDALSGAAVWMEGMALLDKPGQPRKKTAKDQEAARKKLVESFKSKSKVYDNCMMLSVDGDLLCYCDRRRLDWYLKKGLANKISDEPYTIQLLFQHRLTDELNGAHDFYIQSRKNRCVSCGEEGHYLRYKVVPACYRRHFPVHLKSHRSHDVVLLCVDCHHRAQVAADKLKRMIAKEYDVPLNMPKMVPATNSLALEAEARNGGDENNDPLEDQQRIPLRKIRGAAIALKKHGNKLPVARKRELEGVIHQYFSRNPEEQNGLAPQDLERAMIVGLARRQATKYTKKTGLCLEENENAPGPSTGEDPSDSKFMQDGGQMWHGEQVMGRIMENGGVEEINELVRRFRQAFVDYVDPKFLPQNWHVEHCAPREFGEFSIYYQKAREEENNRNSSSADGDNDEEESSQNQPLSSVV